MLQNLEQGGWQIACIVPAKTNPGCQPDSGKGASLFFLELLSLWLALATQVTVFQQQQRQRQPQPQPSERMAATPKATVMTTTNCHNKKSSTNGDNHRDANNQRKSDPQLPCSSVLLLLFCQQRLLSKEVAADSKHDSKVERTLQVLQCQTCV